jgi:hypothetical protein
MSHTPSSPGSRPVPSFVLSPDHRLIVSILFREAPLTPEQLLTRAELLHVRGLMDEVRELSRMRVLYLYADGWGLSWTARGLLELGQTLKSSEVANG